MKSLETLTPGDYLGIVRRRIWYVIITTILVSVGAVAYVWRMPKVYLSETTLALSGRLVPEGLIGSLANLTTSDKIESVRQLLESRTFLARIVQEFQFADLKDSRDLEEALEKVRQTKQFTMLTSTSFKLGYYSTDPSLAQAVTRRLAEAVIQMNDSSRKEKGQVTDQYIDEEVRRTTNDMTAAEDRLLEFRLKHFPRLARGDDSPEGLRQMRTEMTSLETRLQASIAERRTLQRRLEEQRQLRSSAAVAATPPQTAQAPRTQAPPPLPPSPPSPLEVSLANKKNELAAALVKYTPEYFEVKRLKAEVDQLEARVKQARESQPPTPVKALQEEPDLPKAAVVTPVATPRDTSMEFIEADTAYRLEELNRDIVPLEDAKKKLAARIALTEAWLNPAPEMTKELTQLNNDYDFAKRAYQLLADKRLSSQMSLRVDTNDENQLFKVVDPANLPQTAVRPNRRMLAVAGCAVALLFGLGIAFAREFLDSSLHDEADAAAALKVPILVGIPNVPAKRALGDQNMSHALSVVRLPGDAEELGQFSLSEAESKIRDIILEPFSVLGEPYRLMNAKLARMQKERGLKTVLITSSIPGEGKTFTACCLSGVLAREPGTRVLLIDADLRKGSASRALGLEDAPGLQDLLSGTAPADLQGYIRKCAELNLYFLPSGTTARRPGQLSNITEFEQMIERVRPDYDWVILDSPPILALADANLLAPLCDTTLLVVGSGKTNTSLIKEAIQRIGADRIAGLLMNRIRGVSANSYYSGYATPPLKKIRK